RVLSMVWRAKRVNKRQAAAAVEAAVAGIPLSTLPTAARPFDEVGVVSGAAAKTVPEALRNLRRRAYDAGCDAVLGVGICAPATGWVSAGSGELTSAFLAYGTGVRWRAADPG